jgi:hypothetical protein
MPFNPADFPLDVKVISFAEHTVNTGDGFVNCRDTSIPGYPETTNCNTMGGKVTQRETHLEIGNTSYTASCNCDALAPGQYKARWKDEKNLEILSPDRHGTLKVNRYRVLSASLVTPTAHSDNLQREASSTSPCANMAAVDISSLPSGAEITINGHFSGSTPSALELPPGDYTIAIQKTGFKTWERNTTISGGKVTISAELNKSESPQQ